LFDGGNSSLTQDDLKRLEKKEKKILKTFYENYRNKAEINGWLDVDNEGIDIDNLPSNDLDTFGIGALWPAKYPTHTSKSRSKMYYDDTRTISRASKSNASQKLPRKPSKNTKRAIPKYAKNPKDILSINLEGSLNFDRASVVSSNHGQSIKNPSRKTVIFSLNLKIILPQVTSCTKSKNQSKRSKSYNGLLDSNTKLKELLNSARKKHNPAQPRLRMKDFDGKIFKTTPEGSEYRKSKDFRVRGDGDGSVGKYASSKKLRGKELVRKHMNPKRLSLNAFGNSNDAGVDKPNSSKTRKTALYFNYCGYG
jgi:hypothetical protein